MLDFWEKNAYNKDNKSGNQASHLTRQEENPLTELPLRKGDFFAPCALPKPLPLGEVSPKVTERASPAGKSRCAAIGRLFVRAILSLCLGFAVSGLALSVSSQAPRQLPQRGSHWHVGQLSSGRAKRNISETVVLRCLGQRQLDKERCPEAAVPVSKARPFASCRTSGVQ